jgi:hypothetical protein
VAQSPLSPITLRLPTIFYCKREILRALSSAISHWSCTIYPHHRVPRDDTASNGSPTQ